MMLMAEPLCLPAATTASFCWHSSIFHNLIYETENPQDFFKCHPLLDENSWKIWSLSCFPFLGSNWDPQKTSSETLPFSSYGPEILLAMHQVASEPNQNQIDNRVRGGGGVPNP